MPLPFLAARQSARAYRKHAQIQARTHKADMDFEASFRDSPTHTPGTQAET